MIWEDMDTTIRFQLKQFIKQAVQNIVLPVCYQIHRGRAVDPKLVIFADAHHDSRPAAMELLYRSLKKSGNYRIVEHYLDYAQASPAAVAKHSIRFMKLYAFAGTVIICDNFLPVASCRKRKETKVVQLWHACGCYKRFGYDAKDDIPEHYHGANVYRNADLVTVSGNAAVRPFAACPGIVCSLSVSAARIFTSGKAGTNAAGRSFMNSILRPEGRRWFCGLLLSAEMPARQTSRRLTLTGCRKSSGKSFLSLQNFTRICCLH